MGKLSLIVLLLAAVFFSVTAMLLSRMFTRFVRNAQKGTTVECGVPTVGPSRVQFHVGYYLFALIFLIFDVELVFLYPWAVIAKKAGWAGFITIGIFLLILFTGFLYAHKKGALKWIKDH